MVGLRVRISSKATSVCNDLRSRCGIVIGKKRIGTRFGYFVKLEKHGRTTPVVLRKEELKKV